MVLAVLGGLAMAGVATAQVYTLNNPPVTPKQEELALAESVSQYGITWRFDRPARVGRFVTGDRYVVGPVTVTAISPEPKGGRNGSCLNLKAQEKAGFDDRIPFGRYDASLFLSPPIRLKPGDSLLSSISHETLPPPKPFLWRQGDDQRSPVRTVAVLTCLAEPVPPDAFRPAWCGQTQKVYLARNLRRELLPNLSRDGIPFLCHQGRRDEPFAIQDVARWFQRPWIDVAMDEFTAPVENMPVYGREFARAVGLGTLVLCLDFPPEEKEPVLLGLVQVGIDLWGIAGQGSQPTPWNALGGHGNGRKWPILFAGIMLGDGEMQAPAKNCPYLKFSEDTQTMFGPSWTGAKVVYAGHVGKDGHPRHEGWGAYEHLPPAQWVSNIGENYRRCCTSNAWVAEALACRILHAEKVWDHDAFFAYVDRWMTEDDSEAVAKIKEAKGWDYSADWARQGTTWDPFTKAMWKRYRNNLPPAPDGHTDPKDTETWK